MVSRESIVKPSSVARAALAVAFCVLASTAADAQPVTKAPPRLPANPSASGRIPAGVDTGSPASSDTQQLGTPVPPALGAESSEMRARGAAARAAARPKSPASAIDCVRPAASSPAAKGAPGAAADAGAVRRAAFGMAESKLAVFGAIAANVAIAAMKFAGAAATGSSAMLSEGIHSLVDSGDGVLLLVGMRLASRPADERHPFGYGKELYFWSLIVAVLIFGVGGGVSIYEGVLRLLDARPLDDAGWSYAILGAAAVFEGASLAVAVRQFKKSIGDAPFWESLRTSKDPTLYTVMAEDSAALAGLAAAAIGVFGSHTLRMPAFDAGASIVIGLLLCGVSTLLIVQARKLLVGEAVDTDVAEAIRAIAQGEPSVHRAGWPLTMHLGPDDVLLALDAEFKTGVPAEEVARAVNRIEDAVRQRFPEIGRIYIESRRVTAPEAGPEAALSP